MTAKPSEGKIPVEDVLDPHRVGGLYVVPNALSDRINTVLEEALEGMDEEAQGHREHFRGQLLAFFDEYGHIPEITVTKRCSIMTAKPTEEEERGLALPIHPKVVERFTAKPSEGARRAAVIITDKMFDRLASQHGRTKIAWEALFTEIIDRETGVGELVEAAKECVKQRFGYGSSDEMFDRLEEALARVRGEG